MDADDKTIQLFTTRVRQMILQYVELKRQNAEMSEAIDKLKSEVDHLKKQLQQQHDEYNSLKLARMVEITDGDMESANKRLAKLIRDVDKCITLISEEQH